MSTMQALRQHTQYSPIQLETIPIPSASAGTAVIKVLAANVFSYMREIYDGTRHHPYVTPMTPGAGAIGRVYKTGPDAVSLKEGQLVLFNVVMRGRDDPNEIFLTGILHGLTPGGRKLMEYWPDGTYAEYLKAPLENLFPLDEERLCGELGYSVVDLTGMGAMMVPWGGLSDIELKAGQTIVIGPATGEFGGGAVRAALAMGARVIAMGRNQEKLARLQENSAKLFPADRLLTVPIVGNVMEELVAIQKAAGSRGVDVFFDISPPQASKSTHFKAAMLSLKRLGRVSIMGGQQEDVPVPLGLVMHRGLRLQGTWMYTPEQMRAFIKMVEVGNLVLGKKAGVPEPEQFALKDWEQAFVFAAEEDGGVGPVIEPGQK